MVSVGQDDHVSSVEVIPRECFADVDRRRFDAAGRELRLGSRPAARFSWLSRPDFYSTENSEEPNIFRNDVATTRNISVSKRPHRFTRLLSGRCLCATLEL